MIKITFAIKYHYGNAEEVRLDMYDAAISFQGFAKALSITAHALLNEGEIRHTGNRNRKPLMQAPYASPLCKRLGEDNWMLNYEI